MHHEWPKLAPESSPGPKGLRHEVREPIGSGERRRRAERRDDPIADRCRRRPRERGTAERAAAYRGRLPAGRSRANARRRSGPSGTFR